MAPKSRPVAVPQESMDRVQDHRPLGYFSLVFNLIVIVNLIVLVIIVVGALRCGITTMSGAVEVYQEFQKAPLTSLARFGLAFFLGIDTTPPLHVDSEKTKVALESAEKVRQTLEDAKNTVDLLHAKTLHGIVASTTDATLGVPFEMDRIEINEASRPLSLHLGQLSNLLLLGRTIPIAISTQVKRFVQYKKETDEQFRTRIADAVTEWESMATELKKLAEATVLESDIVKKVSNELCVFINKKTGKIIQEAEEAKKPRDVSTVIRNLLASMCAGGGAVAGLASPLIGWNAWIGMIGAAGAGYYARVEYERDLDNRRLVLVNQDKILIEAGIYRNWVSSIGNFMTLVAQEMQGVLLEIPMLRKDIMNVRSSGGLDRFIDSIVKTNNAILGHYNALATDKTIQSAIQQKEIVPSQSNVVLSHREEATQPTGESV